MRTHRLLISCLLLSVATGCASRFTGEWLEEGKLTPAGEVEPPPRDRLMALQFGPLSSVRIGAYLVNAKVVDAETVQSGQYVVFEGAEKAQFGALIAELQDNHLIMTIHGEPQRRFTKMHGKSIFPPIVRPPQLSQRQTDMAPDERYASAAPLPGTWQP